jgi:UDP-4-amino-4,6-dideoxy-N-acetyl-beta-L-altrosamine transaminase
VIPYGRQTITEGDIDAVVKVLQSPYLTQGPVVPQFERIIFEFCRAKHAVATNSATSALHIACLALGLGPGDILWTSPNSFCASANCARFCGAEVDFVDIAPKTYNLCTTALEAKLRVAERSGKLPKVVVPVHFSGQPCEMAQIFDLSQRFGFRIIEDASHAVGATYKSQPIGGCQYSDIAVFSFHPVKIITTGEGGLALTNSSEIAKKMRRLRSHGVTREGSEMVRQLDGPWYYEQLELGFNYRMTDIQAALGISQWSRLASVLAERQEIADRYNFLLDGLPLARPHSIDEVDCSNHLYVIRLLLDRVRRSHAEVFQSLRQKGIGVNLHYIPIHTHPYYQKQGFGFGDFPEAERYYREAISLPIFPGLLPDQQKDIVETLASLLQP